MENQKAAKTITNLILLQPLLIDAKGNLSPKTTRSVIPFKTSKKRQEIINLKKRKYYAVVGVVPQLSCVSITNNRIKTNLP
jgi:hypothetical protein